MHQYIYFTFHNTITGIIYRVIDTIVHGYKFEILCRYDSLLLVAGGIGITPFLSILQELVAAQNSGRYKFLPKIQLIFAVKKVQDICLLNSISPLIFNQPVEKCHLKVKVYVTQEEQSGVTVREALLYESSRVQTVNFDIKSSNHAITGLESPLWMAAVAGISCILFLIFLIIFNHIFIPSQEKATKGKTPSLVVDLLIICSFIAVLICIIFVPLFIRWRRLKKQNPPVFPKQGKVLEISPAEARDGLEEHEIHFGRRPNFEGTYHIPFSINLNSNLFSRTFFFNCLFSRTYILTFGKSEQRSLQNFQMRLVDLILESWSVDLKL